MRSQGFHHHIKLLDIKTGEEYNDKLQFHVVQLKKLENAAKEEKETELYYWAKLLAAKDWKEVDDTIRKGLEEGRKEGKQLFLQCIRLKKQGFSKEKIAEECQVDIPEVEEILKEIEDL